MSDLYQPPDPGPPICPECKSRDHVRAEDDPERPWFCENHGLAGFAFTGTQAEFERHQVLKSVAQTEATAEHERLVAGLARHREQER